MVIWRLNKEQLATMPEGTKLEWHFAERATKDGFVQYLQKINYTIPQNVDIIHTPVKKIN